MKKIESLGKVLNKEEQKSINGGKKRCNVDTECGSNQTCYIPPSYIRGICVPTSWLPS